MSPFSLHRQPVIIVLLFSLLSFSCQTKKEVETNTYEAFLSHLYDRGQFNGNALILEDGEIAFQGAFGIGNINPIDSLTLSSVFRLGSVSKQFTAMAVMILKERGQLSYDQDVRDFIPELPYTGVTVRHLLNHLSGLPDYMEMMDTNWKPELKYDDPERFVSGNIDLIAMFAKMKPAIHFEPGEKWEYSNTGYVLLASIVSRVSGMPFAQFLKEQIFDPAEMTSTVVYQYVPGYDPQMPLRVFGYSTALNGVDREATDIHYLNPVAGDGGIYSTLADLLKWDRILYTEKLISKEGLEEAFTPAVLNNGDTTDYGFGWGIGKTPEGKKVVEHSGGWVGFTTYIYREIEDNNCIIILTNNSTRYFGEVINPLKQILHDQPYDIPKLSIGEAIGKVVVNEGADKAIDTYRKLKSETPDAYNFAERQLNRLGYQLIEIDRTDDAVKILQLNHEEFPQSANACDSFGDALLAKGDTANALIKFKEALSIDSTLSGTKKKIADIEAGKNI